MRNDAQQFQSFAFQTAPRELSDGIDFVVQHLVENDSNNLDAFFFKQRLVERNLIDGFTDAALGYDDDLRAKNLRNLGIGQIKDRANAGMARAFAEHEIFFPRDAVERLLNFSDERFVIGRLEIFASKIRFDSDGAHVDERAIELVNAV